MTAQALCDTDFGRTFLRFSTTRVNHTPRLAVDAACALVPPAGPPRWYFLTCACVGESMYVPRNLIHEPVSEFNLVAAPGEQFLMTKRHASAEHDLRTVHRFGEVMPTHDGKGARVVELAVDVARHARMRRIESATEFRKALLANLPMNGRTTFADDDGQTTVVMEYPLRTINAANDRDAWQVDAGPVLIPGPAVAGGLEAGRFETAFIVFNSFDYAEAVIGQPTPVGAGAWTHHFSRRRNLACRNELFCAD